MWPTMNGSAISLSGKPGASQVGASNDTQVSTEGEEGCLTGNPASSSMLAPQDYLGSDPQSNYFSTQQQYNHELQPMYHVGFSPASLPHADLVQAGSLIGATKASGINPTSSGTPQVSSRAELGLSANASTSCMIGHFSETHWCSVEDGPSARALSQTPAACEGTFNQRQSIPYEDKALQQQHMKQSTPYEGIAAQQWFSAEDVTSARLLTPTNQPTACEGIFNQSPSIPYEDKDKALQQQRVLCSHPAPIRRSSRRSWVEDSTAAKRRCSVVAESSTVASSPRPITPPAGHTPHPNTLGRFKSCGEAGADMMLLPSSPDLNGVTLAPELSKLMEQAACRTSYRAGRFRVSDFGQLGCQAVAAYPLWPKLMPSLSSPCLDMPNLAELEQVAAAAAAAQSLHRRSSAPGTPPPGSSRAPGADPAPAPRESVKMPTRTVMYRVGRFFVSSSDVRTVPLEEEGEEEEEEGSETAAHTLAPERLSMQSSCGASTQSSMASDAVLVDQSRTEANPQPVAAGWVGSGNTTHLHESSSTSELQLGVGSIANSAAAAAVGDCQLPPHLAVDVQAVVSLVDGPVWKSGAPHLPLGPDLSAGQQEMGQQVAKSMKQYSRGRFNIVEGMSPLGLTIDNRSICKEKPPLSPTSVLSPHSLAAPTQAQASMAQLHKSPSCNPRMLSLPSPSDPPPRMLSLPSLSVPPPRMLSLPPPSPSGPPVPLSPSPGLQMRKVGRFTLTEPVPPQALPSRNSTGGAYEVVGRFTLLKEPVPQQAVPTSMSDRNSTGGASDRYPVAFMLDRPDLRSELGVPPASDLMLSVPQLPVSPGLVEQSPRPTAASDQEELGRSTGVHASPAAEGSFMLSMDASSGGALVAETSAPELGSARKPTARKGRFIVY